jgi:DNA-binding NtrC family response regulator
MQIKQILLVDDDEDELDIFKEALGNVSIPLNCLYAQNPETAIQILSDVAPDYMFVDLNMPRINGLQFMAQDKVKICFQKTASILYTNGADEAVCAKAKQLGALACIKKPDSIEKLTKVLDTLINKDISELRSDFKIY